MTICGTPLYSSPELLKKVGYSYKVDIWAIGIICYELLMGRTPFHARNLEDLVSKIDKGDYFINGKDEEMTVECALFLSQCLQSDEMNRIDAD
jgi:serine/threonine protein kinase